MKALKSMRWLLLVSGVLWIILGVTSIFYPVSALVTLAIFVSSAMLVSGIGEIASYCQTAKGNRSGWVLASGILSVILGLWLLIGHGYAALAAMIPYVFSVFILSSGISRTVGSFQLKDVGAVGWGWVLALGILEVVLGFMLMFMPLMSAMLTTATLAAIFIGHGISDIAMFRTSGHIRDFMKALTGKE